jgi:ribonuclease VapC
MVIDTSAVVAILLGEPEAEEFARAVATDSKRLIAAFSVLEAAVVLEVRKGSSGTRELDLLMHEAGIEQVAMDADQVALARDAFRRFGKGRHPARLNIGDCCSYALAIHAGEPLLFKGDDFGKTDVKVAQQVEAAPVPT